LKKVEKVGELCVYKHYLSSSKTVAMTPTDRTYNPYGNLIQDANEGIDQVCWGVNGRVWVVLEVDPKYKREKFQTQNAMINRLLFLFSVCL
jgi:hypothetical protein